MSDLKVRPLKLALLRGKLGRRSAEFFGAKQRI